MRWNLPGWLAMGLGVWAFAACRTLGGPEDAASAYARALADNRLDDAYALTAAEQKQHESRADFAARYARETERNSRAEAILSASSGRVGDLEVKREGTSWRVVDVILEMSAEEALRRFLDAADRKDFASAYRLLAPSWRTQYSPERFKSDFALDPLASERLSRARQALAAGAKQHGEWAEFPIGEGRAVRLVREGRAFRISALE